MDVIVDIDGTIADMRHRRHLVNNPHGESDWPQFFELMVDDKPIWPVIKIVNALCDSDEWLNILICTGRPAIYMEQTQIWLRNHGVDYKEIYMRKEKDYRPDYVVKEEMLLQMRSDGYSPQLALEDKQECVDMWRRNGILTLQNSMKHMP